MDLGDVSRVSEGGFKVGVDEVETKLHTEILSWQRVAVRRFRRRDFVERPTGGVRLTAPLARELAEGILPLARQAAGSVCEGLARSLAEGFEGPRTHVKRPMNLTGDARSRGRDRIRQGPRKEANAGRQAASALAPSACRSCGVVLEGRRVICDECLPDKHGENTRSFAENGRERLAAMRAAGADPSKTPEAKAKLATSISRRNAENKEWERTHEMPHPSEWDAILSGLADISVWATGLAPSTCHRVIQLDKSGMSAKVRGWAFSRRKPDGSVIKSSPR